MKGIHLVVTSVELSQAQKVASVRKKRSSVAVFMLSNNYAWSLINLAYYKLFRAQGSRTENRKSIKFLKRMYSRTVQLLLAEKERVLAFSMKKQKIIKC